MAIRAFYRATTFLFPMYLSNNENDFSFLSFFLFLDWLGPLSWSVSSVCSPLVFNLCRRKNVRILSLVGGFLFPLSLLFTSFATELHQIFFRWVQKSMEWGIVFFFFRIVSFCYSCWHLVCGSLILPSAAATADQENKCTISPGYVAKNKKKSFRLCFVFLILFTSEFFL